MFWPNQIILFQESKNLKFPKLKQVKHKQGNCYEDCLNILIENKTKRTIRLVHGYPKLASGKHKGKRYGHAWIEITDSLSGSILVIDHRDQGNSHFRENYYFLGKILESQVTRYTFKEASKLALQHNHSGPFNTIPKGAMFLSEENHTYKSTKKGFKKVQHA